MGHQKYWETKNKILLIETQKTPNPNALKFILPEKKFPQPLSFASAELAATHPLAAALFALGDVYNVFMVQDFITVNKLPAVPWAGLETAILEVIAQYFSGSVGQ